MGRCDALRREPVRIRVEDLMAIKQDLEGHARRRTTHVVQDTRREAVSHMARLLRPGR